MATRTRETAPVGKEKRGTSPIHHQRSSTNTSKTSPVRKQADPTITTSSLNKNVPSYLKPTIAQANKTASSSDLHSTRTSSLARRRSFDNKPPVPSSSTKTRISPSPRERLPRSSSLSTKTSTSQKPLFDRLSKTTNKDVTGKARSAGLNSRPVTKKKTTTTTTMSRKHDSASGSTTKSSVSTNSPDIAENVISQGEQSEPEDHQELTIHETEKETIISDNEMVADSDAGENANDSATEDHIEELINDSATEDHIEELVNDSATEDHIEELINENVRSLELGDIKAAPESSTLVENPQIKIEEPEEISNEPKSPEKEKDETIINASTEENQESKDETIINASTEENQESKDETIINASTEENQESKDETIINASTEENQESKDDEGKVDRVIEESEAVQQEQLSPSPKQVGICVEESTEPEPVMVAASAKPQHQVVQGMNKESVVSNDVIEETASKLREQRKNKVKALAGAFETVISLQDHK